MGKKALLRGTWRFQGILVEGRQGLKEAVLTIACNDANTTHVPKMRSSSIGLLKCSGPVWVEVGMSPFGVCDCRGAPFGAWWRLELGMGVQILAPC